MKVFYVGAPGPCGGANVEMAHTIKVWRDHEIEVAVIPTWGIDAATRTSLEQIGCTVHEIGTPDNIGSVPGLAGGVVMSMCNQHFFKIYAALKTMRCKTIWSNAMTFLFDHEINAFHFHGMADVIHFQSEFQKEELEKLLIPLGYNHGMGQLIRGAFDFAAVPFAPRYHDKNTDFVIGRLSRPDLDKWSSNHWNILGRVPYAQRRALAMGWTPATLGKCGPPPAWAETLTPNQIPVVEFLSRCHAMLGLNGGARENWPRIGLESMAAGVPLVVQNQWGWKEMVIDGETGFLTDSDEEMAYRLAQLAYDEELRRYLIAEARDHVEELADPARIGQQWRELFVSLGA